MYTRCPKCQTVFRITAAQLKLRAGTVRCGRCQHVFGADQHMLAKPPAGKQNPPAAVRKRPSGRKPGSGTVKSPVAPVPAPIILETLPLPLVRDLPARTRTLYWAAGWALLILLLVAQTLVFYGYDIVRLQPMLRPIIETVCDPLPCRTLPPIDMQHLDLVETRVTPHPRYDKVLRIKATLVNRADRNQPYPLLEVSLIDNQGQLVARRAYRPREYLNKPAAIQQGLAPQVAVDLQLDITSPGKQANGYEILLLPPTEK